MGIEVTCSNCHQKFLAPATSAGKHGKCPQCRAPLQVPLDHIPAATDKTSVSDLERELGLNSVAPLDDLLESESASDNPFLTADSANGSSGLSPVSKPLPRRKAPRAEFKFADWIGGYGLSAATALLSLVVMVAYSLYGFVYTGGVLAMIGFALAAVSMLPPSLGESQGFMRRVQESSGRLCGLFFCLSTLWNIPFRLARSFDLLPDLATIPEEAIFGMVIISLGLPALFLIFGLVWLASNLARGFRKSVKGLTWAYAILGVPLALALLVYLVDFDRKIRAIASPPPDNIAASQNDNASRPSSRPTSRRNLLRPTPTNRTKPSDSSATNRSARQSSAPAELELGEYQAAVEGYAIVPPPDFQLVRRSLPASDTGWTSTTVWKPLAQDYRASITVDVSHNTRFSKGAKLPITNKNIMPNLRAPIAQVNGLYIVAGAKLDNRLVAGIACTDATITYGDVRGRLLLGIDEDRLIAVTATTNAPVGNPIHAKLDQAVYSLKAGLDYQPPPIVDLKVASQVAPQGHKTPSTKPITPPSDDLPDSESSTEITLPAPLSPDAVAERVVALAISPDGEFVATGDDLGIVSVRHFDGSKVANPIRVTEKSLYQVAVSNSGQWLASSSVFDQNLRIWDVSKDEPVMQIKGSADRFVFSPSSSQLACAVNRDLVFIDLETRQESSRRTCEMNVEAIGFSTNGRYLAHGVRNGDIVVWDIQGQREVFHHAGHADRIDSVSFSPDMTKLLSAGRDGKMILWESKTGSRLLEADVRSESCGFLSNGTEAFSYRGMNIDIWDVKTGTGIQRFRFDEPPSEIALSEDGSRAVHYRRFGQSQEVQMWTRPQE